MNQNTEAIDNTDPDLIGQDTLHSSQEQGEGAGAALNGDTDSLQAQTLGAVLQNLRQQSGLDVASLASVMKVSARKIEALEEDRLEELPDLVFARGLVSSICRFYKVDVQAVLGLMPQVRSAKDVVVTTSLQEKLSSPPTSRWGAFSAMFSPKSLLMALLLLVGALVIIFLPKMDGANADKQMVDAPVSAPNSAASTQLDNSVTQAATPTLGTEADNTSLPTAQATPPSDTATGVSTNPSTAPNSVATNTAATNTAVAANGSAASAGASASLQGDIVFQSTDDSWVTVRQINENGRTTKTLFSGMVKAGSPVPVEAQPPFAVTVGRADVTKVQVKGQNYDLSAISKGNQARFTIKE